VISRDPAEEVDVPAHLFRGRNDQRGITHDRAKDGQIAMGVAPSRDHRAEVGVDRFGAVVSMTFMFIASICRVVPRRTSVPKILIHRADRFLARAG
jgi:hypothetical protein